ncbi:SLAP domain-containing protein [Companilactobacillus baiquanensis]|uniref:SLAP domain-containing protein n=1 Tax=Companilactobacillus baiquanensis TaxID=2486005 RepID=A0ABW1UUY9_9LACO|nr:SLAP domain-containing protein [Companilactobacillus baiquanensis]
MATTTKKVNLYDDQGNLITNRGLDINTTWHSDQEFTYNGQKYYRVAPNEYVKASDVYLYKNTDTSLVSIFNDGDGSLVDYLGNEARTLSPATDWKTDRIALINGNEYYRLSTNEFIEINKVQPYMDDFENLNTINKTNVYDEHGNELDVKLPKSRSYKTDRIVNINGANYYRVSTNAFVKADEI